MNWITIWIKLLIITGLGAIVGLAVDVLVQLFGPPITRLIAILLLIVTIPGLVLIWKRIQVAWARVVVLLGGLIFTAAMLVVVFL